MRTTAWLVLTLLTFAAWCSATRAQEPPADDIGQVVKRTQRKMVKVFGATAGRVEGFGTGILVSPDGMIVTAQGVYLDGSQVRVVLADGSEHQATVLKRDRTLQLALLRIERETPDYFDLSRPPEFARGDWILAISNAFKVADHDEPLSVMLGNISLATTIDAQLSARDVAYRGELILIDAITSNPGAAGGAVIDLHGNLIGSIGKIINSSETNTRLNYAIPAPLLAKFVAGTALSAATEATTETANRPVELGIRLLTVGSRRNPAYIDQVTADGPAAKAGLQPDDLIISIGGEKIGSVNEYETAIGKLRAGEEVLLIIKRGSKVLQVPLTPIAKQ